MPGIPSICLGIIPKAKRERFIAIFKKDSPGETMIYNNIGKTV